ncbi:MAG: aspartyl protease family protein [Nitrospira sp.]|nr:aspartyl protease family protein [Nitrospira sp.]
MLVATGRYNGSDPVLKISIGPDPENFQQFDAIIDTGCTGFLSIPSAVAGHLNIKPDHAQQLTYADGKTHAAFGALGYASIGGKVHEGTITIEEHSVDILLGIDFLRRFKLAIFMTSKHIILMDENELEKLQQMKVIDQQAGVLDGPPP